MLNALSKDIDKEDIKAKKYDYVKSLKLDLKGENLTAMSDSDISTRNDYTSWGLLKCRMAYRLETRKFVCWANMYSGWILRFGVVALGRVCAQYTILYQI